MKSTALNATAYRIYRLLTWLMEAPHSSEELNMRFLEEARIRRRLSEDSLWLYMNTLKRLGCEISRPVPANGYKYELLQHPFGITLSEEHLDTIVRSKALAKDHFSYSQMLCLDGFFKKIINRASLPLANPGVMDFFGKSRSIDYESRLPMIETLHQAINNKSLLMITYLSPLESREKIYFLPEEQSYRQGVLYVRGVRPDREDLSFLRVDRIQDLSILSIEDTAHAEIYDALLNIQCNTPRILLRLYHLTPENFETFGLGEEIESFSTDSPPYLQLSLRTRDFFALKQKLLGNGYPFRILEPQSFRQEMENTLRVMKKLYEKTG